MMTMVKTLHMLKLAGSVLAALPPQLAGQARVVGDLGSPPVLVERYQGGRGAEESEPVVRTVRLGPSGEVDLTNVAGDIVVQGGDGEDVRIDALKRATPTRSQDAKSQLARTDVRVEERPGRVQIRTVHGGSGVAVDYRLTVPHGTILTVKSVSGDVVVRNVKGETRTETVNGNVEIEQAGRLAAAKSVSGDVRIVSGSDDAEVTASSVSGTVVARGIKARSLEAGTVSGDVLLENVACARARVHSVSGNVEYAGTVDPHGRYELKSHSGDVRLVLGSAAGFEVDAMTFSGEVQSDLPVTMQGAGAGSADADQRGGRGRTIRGVYGDGSAVLEIATFSGDIYIKKK
jgi:DUF4097 and DUF4098 domain-containing protein YvlB